MKSDEKKQMKMWSFVTDDRRTRYILSMHDCSSKNKTPRTHHFPSMHACRAFHFQSSVMVPQTQSRRAFHFQSSVMVPRTCIKRKTPRSHRTVHSTLDLYTVCEDHASVTSHVTRMRDFGCCG